MNNYRKALKPEQAVEMNRFLHFISWAANKAKEVEVNPDVGLFLKVWIGLPISKEEKRVKHRRLQEDYRKRRKVKVKVDGQC